MPRARVRVVFASRIVEDRLIDVRELLRLGEGPGAVLAFPGADMVLVPAGRDILVDGRRLSPGEGLSFQFGQVDLWVENPSPGTRMEGRSLSNSLMSFVDPTWIAILLFVVVLSALWDQGMGARVTPILGALGREVMLMVRGQPCEDGTPRTPQAPTPSES